MKRSNALLAFLVVLSLGAPVWADPPEVGSRQNVSEKENQAVVRNKRFFKGNQVELGIGGGLMPYDSTLDTYTLGAHLDWHFNDHWAWEIIEYQKTFSSVTSFITSKAADNNMNLQDLQVIRPNSIIGTNLLVSPFYGKIRMLGVVYLDIYLIAGLGFVNTTTLRYTHTSGTSYNTTEVNSGYDFAINYGVGFKFFLNNTFTLYFDLRNYMANSFSYGRRGFGSNFTSSLGLSIFLPNFG